MAHVGKVEYQGRLYDRTDEILKKLVPHLYGNAKQIDYKNLDIQSSKKIKQKGCGC